MPVSYVALGANLAGPQGDPAASVRAAMRALDGGGVRVTAQSRLYRSAAWPDPLDPPFVNAVAAIETGLPPEALLARLHGIETDFGRIRRAVNAPRPLDLDIVDYAGKISRAGQTPILPHPRLAERAFVLLPLRDVAPAWRHPATGLGIGELIAALPDPSGAEIVDS